MGRELPRYTHISHTLVLDIFICDEAVDLRGHGVDGAEAEDVEEHDAAVVDEVLNRAAGQG